MPIDNDNKAERHLVSNVRLKFSDATVKQLIELLILRVQQLQGLLISMLGYCTQLDTHTHTYASSSSSLLTAVKMQLTHTRITAVTQHAYYKTVTEKPLMQSIMESMDQQISQSSNFTSQPV